MKSGRNPFRTSPKISGRQDTSKSHQKTKIYFLCKVGYNIRKLLIESTGEVYSKYGLCLKKDEATYLSVSKYSRNG